VKRLFSFLVIILASIITFVSCTKDSTTTPVTPTCDVKGTYSGTSLASTGATSTLTYILKENNLAVGRV